LEIYAKVYGAEGYDLDAILSEDVSLSLSEDSNETINENYKNSWLEVIKKSSFMSKILNQTREATDTAT
jgi:hypothetical protein